MKPQTNTDKHRLFSIANYVLQIKNFRFLSVCICVYLCLIFLPACKSVPTDLRTLAPAETLVYLETNDLAKTLNALTESKAFQELARDKPDFSQFEKVQIALVVTGFETSEQKVTSEDSVLNFKPHFALVADTHAWKWTAVSIAENQIGNFARKTYGENVKLEKSKKADAEFFVWTGSDGRKLFSVVSGSVIYAGNDETLLDKCLAVKRKEAENLLKNENLARAREGAATENNLAFGYVSTEGAAQIANLAGVSTAIEATEEDAARSFIAGILPQILQNTTREIVWSANKTEQGIEDKFSVSLNEETASVFNESMTAPAEIESDATEFLPSEMFSATVYNLKNPLIAWRSLLFVTARNTDNLSGKFLIQFSGSLLEPYGISDAESFLSAVGSPIITAQFDHEAEKSVVIVSVKDAEKLRKSISSEINFKAQPERLENADVWQSENREMTAAFIENTLILGESESIFKCLRAKQSKENFTKNQVFKKFNESRAVAATFAKDTESAEKIIEVLGNVKDANNKITLISLTETRFTEKKIERKIVSAFGFIGTIIEQFSK